MNAKKCKAIRKMLRNLHKEQEAGNPEAALPERSYGEIEGRRKYMLIDDPNSKGQLGTMTEEYIPAGKKKIQIATGQIVLQAKCKRAIYKHFKKEVAKSYDKHSSIHA